MDLKCRIHKFSLLCLNLFQFSLDHYEEYLKRFLINLPKHFVYFRMPIWEFVI